MRKPIKVALASIIVVVLLSIIAILADQPIASKDIQATSAPTAVLPPANTDVVLQYDAEASIESASPAVRISLPDVDEPQKCIHDILPEDQIVDEIVEITEPLANVEIAVRSIESEIVATPKPERYWLTYQTEVTPESIDLLAHLLAWEAGTLNFEGQVWTCSAILNVCIDRKVDLWTAAHNYEIFRVAPYVDNDVDTTMQYQVIEEVLNGWREWSVTSFRTKHYHTFGIPVCEVDGHWFSTSADWDIEAAMYWWGPIQDD